MYPEQSSDRGERSDGAGGQKSGSVRIKTPGQLTMELYHHTCEHSIIMTLLTKIAGTLMCLSHVQLRSRKYENLVRVSETGIETSGLMSYAWVTACWKNLWDDL